MPIIYYYISNTLYNNLLLQYISLLIAYKQVQSEIGERGRGKAIEAFYKKIIFSAKTKVGTR